MLNDIHSCPSKYNEISLNYSPEYALLHLTLPIVSEINQKSHNQTRTQCRKPRNVHRVRWRGNQTIPVQVFLHEAIYWLAKIFARLLHTLHGTLVWLEWLLTASAPTSEMISAPPSDGHPAPERLFSAPCSRAESSRLSYSSTYDSIMRRSSYNLPFNHRYLRTSSQLLHSSKQQSHHLHSATKAR